MLGSSTVLGTATSVCWDEAAGGWESSRGLEHTLQDGERPPLLRKTEMFLCSFSFMWWLEESTWWMFLVALARNAGLQPRTRPASLLPLVLPQCDCASWVSCFPN